MPGRSARAGSSAYGIDAAVHELNVNWIAGLDDYPSGAHWERYGGQLARVFDEYFDAVKP